MPPRGLLAPIGASVSGARSAALSRFVPLVPVGALPVSGATVTSGTADYGTWVELSASTPVDWYGFRVVATGTAALVVASNNIAALLDIGTGGAGAEAALLTVDVSNRAANFATWSVVDAPLVFIPRGTRVAARLSSLTTARTVSISLQGYKSADPTRTPRRATPTALVTPASQRGAAVAAGASWTEVVAATGRAHFGLIVSIGNNDASGSGGLQAFDLAFGAAGSETLVWSTRFGIDTSEFMYSSDNFVPVVVPPGTRIAARSTTDPVSVTIHGL